ncbi:hypothetical protein MYXO_01346 [Myxococcaceae bacterium]|nr:hypothetical protein MYXO_01346 [Myxococcaceae bacterium]
MTSPLLDLADSVRFLQSLEGEPFAHVPVGNHFETLALRGRGFDGWLRDRHFEVTGKAAPSQAVADALGVFEHRARLGEHVTVSVRLASPADGLVYLDLGGRDHRVVEVSATGWRVIEGADSPVYFRRPGGMLEIPTPERGGSLDELRPFVNVGSAESWRLVAGWLVAALRPRGPYPLLVLLGEQGCAKSTTARVLRRIIDPNKAELRAEPRSVEDLVLAGSNGLIVALDNVSNLQPWLSDALCRIATGGGLSRRRLYTDSEEALFDISRPTLVNGIGDVISRPDLLDRSFLVTLPRIEDSARRREAEFWREYALAHPRILGALLDAVSTAIRTEDTIAESIGPLPRMADAACWIEAAAPALGWERGEFLAAYSAARADARELALDASDVGRAVQAMMDGRVEYRATATDLLIEIAKYVPEQTTRGRAWPRTARALTSALQRVAPVLRAAGIDLAQERDLGRQRRRLWRIVVSPRDDRPDRPNRPNVSDIGGLGSDGPRSQPSAGASSADTSADCGHNDRGDRPNVTPRNRRGSDGPDGSDDLPGHSQQWPEAEGLIDLLEPEPW